MEPVLWDSGYVCRCAEVVGDVEVEGVPSDFARPFVDARRTLETDFAAE